MVRIAWRSLTAHKLRTVLTILAILLGVAMISGTYVLTDQIDRGFKQVFTDAYKGTDVTVTRQTKFSGQLTGATEGLPQDMVKQVDAVDGVAASFGYVAGQGAVAVDGKVVETGGSPDALLLVLAQRHRPAAVHRGASAGAVGRGGHHPEARPGQEARAPARRSR